MKIMCGRFSNKHWTTTKGNNKVKTNTARRHRTACEPYSFDPEKRRRFCSRPSIRYYIPDLPFVPPPEDLFFSVRTVAVLFVKASSDTVFLRHPDGKPFAAPLPAPRFKEPQHFGAAALPQRPGVGIKEVQLIGSRPVLIPAGTHAHHRRDAVTEPFINKNIKQLFRDPFQINRLPIWAVMSSYRHARERISL